MPDEAAFRSADASPEASDGAVAPEGVLAAGDRRARQRTLAHQAEARQRTRRRIIPAALVGASVLAVAGAADRFVAQAVASATAPSGAPSVSASPAAPTKAPSGAKVSSATLDQIAKTLAADRRAIVALAQAQAQLARQAGGDGGGGGALPSVALPSLPALPSASSIAVPSAPAAAPATHATTGASVVVP